jgi:very-short-patch-repair endonuclease
MQQNFKEMNICKNCGKETKNKVYCSVKCQHIGYKKIKIERVKIKCLFCKTEFETLPYKIENGRKYCSRSCKDAHQKELYLRDGNPLFNVEHSDEWRKSMSQVMKKIWATEEHRKKVNNGQQKFFNENGFWVGSDHKSCQKRIKTNLDKYGVGCVLELKKYREVADNTCLVKYGQTAFDMMRKAGKKKKGTSIEVKISNILIENRIKFETQFEIYYDNNKFKSYDFYLKDFNLLIEADGDYWHGNPIKYNDLNILTETQLMNIENDKIKSKLALEKGYRLERFWETDINKKNFKFLLANTIKKYEN